MTRIRTSLFLAALVLVRAAVAMASTTWYVDGVNGSDGGSCTSPETACKTIGHAISRVSTGDSIIVAPATYTENLTIGISLKLIGSGANTTIIDGGGVNRVVEVSNTAANVTLSGLTLRNGTVAWRGSIAFQGGGAGILNNGKLLVLASSVTGNLVSVLCPGPYGTCLAAGGGIYNSTGAKLTIANSTIAANTIRDNCSHSGCIALADGGGIYNQGALLVSNSTVAENATHAFQCCSPRGGGISNRGPGPATISNSTLSGNSPNNLSHSYQGPWQVIVQNSILANSSTGANCSGTIISNGYNLSSDSTCSFNHAGDLNDHDPLLGPLQNNGGPTETMALLSGSAAIDAGNPAGCTDGQGSLLKTDQRGLPRPNKEDTGGCDMGAYERQGD